MVEPMRAVVQRVVHASVAVNGHQLAQIGRGLAVLVGVAAEDTPADVAYLAGKIAGLRVFEDRNGKLNLSVADIGGSVLLVSQFTLYGDCRKGRRPSFTRAADPERAAELYGQLAEELRARGLPVQCGQFRAHMQLSLVNDGPVTLLLDSSRSF